MNYEIPLSYTPVDYQGLAEVLKQKKNAPGELVSAFESVLKEYSGMEVVAVNSGTSAIHLGLKALGVGPGDNIIVPTFTYIATVNPVRYLGAIPVFIGSDPVTWNMDPVLLEKAIQELVAAGKKPRAIIVVHTYGMPQEMNEILRISNAYSIPVLEDAAEAIGTTYQGKVAGTFGEIGVLSFNNNKILTAYGGWAVLCRSKEVAAKILFWSTQSREPLPWYEHAETGYNYRMSPLNAAMGLASWPRLNQKVAERQAIFRLYQDTLTPLGWVFPMAESIEANRWITVALVPENGGNKVREKCIQALRDNKIEVRYLWNPLHKMPLFTSCKKFDNYVAESLFSRGICLPSGVFEDENVIRKVLQILTSISG